MWWSLRLVLYAGSPAPRAGGLTQRRWASGHGPLHDTPRRPREESGWVEEGGVLLLSVLDIHKHRNNTVHRLTPVSAREGKRGPRGPRRALPTPALPRARPPLCSVRVC